MWAVVEIKTIIDSALERKDLREEIERYLWGIGNRGVI